MCGTNAKKIKCNTRKQNKSHNRLNTHGAYKISVIFIDAIIQSRNYYCGGRINRIFKFVCETKRFVFRCFCAHIKNASETFLLWKGRKKAKEGDFYILFVTSESFYPAIMVNRQSLTI